MLITIDHVEAHNAIRDSLAAELKALGLIVPTAKLAAMARNVAHAVIMLDPEDGDHGADPDYHTAEQNDTGGYGSGR